MAEKLQKMKRSLYVLGGILFTIALTLMLAFVLPQRKDIYDFVMLYSASLGIIKHVPIYDATALETLIEVHIGAAPGTIVLFPHPYPPWYALSTFYLGFLSPRVAANAWLLINIALLVTAVLLLTDAVPVTARGSEWKLLHRILAVLAGLLFIPAMGLLVVGQYSAPVLLGAALFVYSVRRQDAPLTALGLLLTTYKPHIGILLLLSGFLWLVFQKTSFARRALWMTGGGGVFLAVIGFLADPAWPLAYIQSLLGYRQIPGVSSCELCASLSVAIVRIATGHSNTIQAAWVSLILAAGLGGCLFWHRRALFTESAALTILSITLTLLIDPYLLNYDYVLLLVPLALLAQKTRGRGGQIALAIAYLLPWGMLIFGRWGNIFVTLAGVLILALHVLRPPIDANLQWA